MADNEKGKEIKEIREGVYEPPDDPTKQKPKPPMTEK